MRQILLSHLHSSEKCRFAEGWSQPAPELGNHCRPLISPSAQYHKVFHGCGDVPGNFRSLWLSPGAASMPWCRSDWKHRGLNFHPKRKLKSHLEEHHESAICPLLKQPCFASDMANRGKTWDFICPYSVFNNNTDPGLVIKNLKQYTSPGGSFPFSIFIAHVFF